MLRRLLISGGILAALAATPVRLLAASKEILELQRDVALLQEQVKQLQQSQDKNFTALTVLTQQALDAANKASTAVAVIQNGFQQNVQTQEEKVVAPVVGLTTRMNGLSDDLRTVSQAVSDLASQISKIQSQLTDLSNAVKVMAAPPAPPPATGTNGVPGTDSSGGVPAGNMTASIPPISSQALYDNAGRDKNAGNYDLAMQEYSDYLKYYGNTELAPNAQFYIGTIHYGQGDFQKAASDFDQVLEKYSENPKTEEALYYKGLSLAKLGQRTQAGDQFRQLITNYPHTERATQACNQLQALGYRCPTTHATTKKKRGE